MSSDLWKALAGLEEPAIVATIVRVRGSAPREAGARILIHRDGRILGTLGGGRLEHRVRAEAHSMLEEGAPSAHRTYRLNPSEDQCCGGEVEVFLERCSPGPRVLLFGAGHVGEAVARALAPLPFRVTVIDSRAEYMSADRFPEGTDLRCGDPVELLGAIRTSAEDTYALVFTHSHRLDLALVSLLVARPLRLLGIIGSATKLAGCRTALGSRGVSEADLGRITCPIGIGVGGKLPAEIAASVAAQLLAIRDGLTVEIRAREAADAAAAATTQLDPSARAPLEP